MVSILIRRLFSDADLADSCAQGIKNQSEKLPLDIARVSAIKEYVMLFCKKHDFHVPSTKAFNAAINTQVTYARKKLKRSLKKSE